MTRTLREENADNLFHLDGHSSESKSEEDLLRQICMEEENKNSFLRDFPADSSRKDPFSVETDSTFAMLNHSQSADIINAARNLYSKRTRTLMHWINPKIPKARLKMSMTNAWDQLPEWQKKIYISQVLGKFSTNTVMPIVNPELLTIHKISSNLDSQCEEPYGVRALRAVSKKKRTLDADEPATKKSRTETQEETPVESKSVKEKEEPKPLKVEEVQPTLVIKVEDEEPGSETSYQTSTEPRQGVNYWGHQTSEEYSNDLFRDVRLA